MIVLDTPESIEAAAIKRASGEVVSLPAPARHCDIICHIAAPYKPGKPTIILADGGVQGFVTNTGRFVTREEAYTIAKEAGQILQR